MLIIVDKRIPEASKIILRTYGDLIEFDSNNVVYEAISGHPDMFICQIDNKLIISPSAPTEIVNQLHKSNIELVYGILPIGMKYPETAKYNAVITNKSLICNMKVADRAILDICVNRTPIHTNQAYTRCNLIALDDDNFITSDKSIERALLNKQLNVLFVSPESIILKGFKHGFFGGCCGVYEKKIFIIGRLNHFSAKESVISFLTNAGYTIVELYDGPLIDGGGIFFMKS
jgi:hypothetical protein